MRVALKSLIACILLSLPVLTLAQSYETPYTGRPRYPDGLLTLRVGAGVNKYTGEFTDQSTGNVYSFHANYAVFPTLNIGLGAMFGTAGYHRRARRNTVSAYDFQFGTENNVLRETSFNSYFVELLFNFFPREYFNGYLLVGAGSTFFTPEDYNKEQVRIRPDNDHLAGLTIPVGLGAEYFLTRNFSINAEFRHQFLFNDRFDAFPSQELREKYGAPGDAEKDEADDAYFTLTAGVRLYLFENNDIDGDLLLNSEEEHLATNPFDVDTDGDGLTDYEEVRTYKSNPLVKDSDGDGLNDYVEVIKYRTDPTKGDTDGDGLSDGDEVLIHNTNPLNPDTDGDEIGDKEELGYGTNPNRYDTDGDGLSDGEEILKYKTNPLEQDTDGEGLGDYEEIMAYKTDPLKPDTDGDRLTDFEEILRYGTSPFFVDTDGDTLSDYDELKTIGTDPLKKDTDSDGINDNLDKCPLIAEVYNGFQDEDGCPDIAPRDPAIAEKGEAKPGERIRLSRSLVDTVRLKEGSIITLFGVNFEVDKDVIRPESFPILEENAKLFKAYPELEVEIRGHTDSDASDEYNQDLSERRAASVKQWLVKYGDVAEPRMTTKGFGESQPVVPNTDPISKARNRRIEFFITKFTPEKKAGELPLDTTRQRAVPPKR